MNLLILFIYSITLILLIVFNVYIYHAILSTKLGKYPPFVPTETIRKKIVIDEVSKIIKTAKSKITFLDAGSGTGTILIPLAKKFPEHNFVGIEWGKILFKISKIRGKKIKNLKLINNNMLTENFEKYDIIYCYALKSFYKVLSEKIVQETKKDCLVIINGTSFDNMKIVKEINVKTLTNNKSVFFQKHK